MEREPGTLVPCCSTSSDGLRPRNPNFGGRFGRGAEPPSETLSVLEAHHLGDEGRPVPPFHFHHHLRGDPHAVALDVFHVLDRLGEPAGTVLVKRTLFDP